jgi:hypothetical protein
LSVHGALPDRAEQLMSRDRESAALIPIARALLLSFVVGGKAKTRANGRAIPQ